MSSPITNTFGSRRISCATASAMARATVSFLSFTAVVIVVSCSAGQRAGADDDLDVAVLVVGQLLEALFENVVQADATGDQRGDVHARSEERRVGKECRAPRPLYKRADVSVA